jgi:hypothetical protein
MRTLLDNRTVQLFLKTHNHYTGKVDGNYGPLSNAAGKSFVERHFIKTEGWNQDRIRTATEQIILKKLGFHTGAIDGRIGPQTLDALERYQNKIRDREPPSDHVEHQPTTWPREKNVIEFFGEVGKNQVILQLPYAMRLAWDTKTTVQRFSCNAKVHDSLKLMLNRVLAHYGEQEIKELGLDLFGGCLNVRQKKGGRSYSMHAWGIAIDIDPLRNQFRWGRDQARLADPVYNAFWRFVEEAGWISLGREKNFDWMHFQAARF